MYEKTDLFDKRKEKREERDRMQTEKELKSLLTKYIGPDRAKYAVQNAQHQIGILAESMDKTTNKMRKMN